MRYLLPLLSLFFLSFFCKAQTLSSKDKLKNDLTALNLKRKVKSVTETYYDIIENQGGPQKVKPGVKYVSKYNDKGFETEFSSYDPGSSKPATTRFTKYDTKGKKIEESDNFNLSGETVTTKGIFKYDGKGNLVEQTYNNGLKYTYKYNDQNRLIDKSIFEKNGNDFKAGEKDITKYDEKGNQTEFTALNADGSLMIKHVYRHDARNNLIEETIFITEGKPASKTIFRYDEKGNRIEQTGYDANGKQEYFLTNKYNDQGILIETKEGLDQMQITKYDNNGNAIEFSSKSINNTYKYEFNKQGDWVKKTEYHSNKPAGIVERVIEYY